MVKFSGFEDGPAMNGREEGAVFYFILSFTSLPSPADSTIHSSRIL